MSSNRAVRARSPAYFQGDASRAAGCAEHSQKIVGIGCRHLMAGRRIFGSHRVGIRMSTGISPPWRDWLVDGYAMLGCLTIALYMLWAFVALP